MLLRSVITAAACGLLFTNLSAQCDLTVSSFTTTNKDLVAGAPLRVTFTVSNTTNTRCPKPFVATLRLSADAGFSLGDIKLAEVAIPALLGKSSKACTLDLRVPYCVATGDRHLVVRADANAEVAELAEVNNDASLKLPAKAWFGTPRIEYQPVQNFDSTLEDATVSAWAGGRVRMCVTAPKHVGDWYLVVWSGSKQFKIDDFTTFSLFLTNSVFHPNWFQRLQTAYAYPEYWMPQGIRFNSSFKVYVHSWFVNPSFTTFTGITGNSVSMTIKS